MSAPYEPYSDASGSDSDDAPEEVTLSSAKKGLKEEQKKALEEQRRRAQEKREKAKSKKAKQAAKGKGKAKQVEQDEDEEEEEEEPAFAEAEEYEEEDVEGEVEAVPPPQIGKKTTYLDDDLFAEAAEVYEQAEKDAEGGGEEDLLEQAREQRRMMKQAERDAMVKEGGKRRVGDITLQHVASSIGPALTSSAHPSQTSATKFLNQRLYSKKRQVAVLASSAPQPNQERNPKKQKKGGLSLETRMLLGLDEPEDLEKEKQKEKRKKKSLLLQAEGQRKSAASRPISAVRRGAKPAANFARSSFQG
ncbi:uncharacterized protein JCM6883_002289 [Sporobolomyces salmoneus]|uniref:uncharacterized protein n=1 Tax=Sporobolomyces salmoneus TaxID=183962 RepID=UPI0031814A0E